MSGEGNPRPLEHVLRYQSTNPAHLRSFNDVFFWKISSDSLHWELDFPRRIEEKLFQHFLRNLNINGTGAVIASPGDVPALSLRQQVWIDVATALQAESSN